MLQPDKRVSENDHDVKLYTNDETIWWCNPKVKNRLLKIFL